MAATTTTRVSIKNNYNGDSTKHRAFIVRCHKHRIFTTVTSKTGVVRCWLHKVITTYSHFLLRNRLIVGLGVFWAPDTPDTPAVLALCVGRHCLLLQLGLAAQVPISLRRFLAHPSNKFLGVWNHRDGPMLEESMHNLEVSTLVDLRHVAAEKAGTGLQISMEKMAEEILGFNGVKKDVETGKSDWNACLLNDHQVLYASLDAFLSFQLGKTLKLWDWNHHSIREPSPVNVVSTVDNGRGDDGFESCNNDAFTVVVEHSSGGEPSLVDEYEFVDNDNGYEASPRPRLAASDDGEYDECYNNKDDECHYNKNGHARAYLESSIAFGSFD